MGTRAHRVSLIIPVHNALPAFTALLDSVSAQTYADYETIFIDDASTDGSGALCDEYAATHPNATVLHMQRGGLSAARNAGVACASGEYVVFSDADDVLSEDYLEHLVGLVDEFEVDLAICEPCAPSLSALGSDEKHVRGCYSPDELMPYFCQLGCGAYSKIYKRELIARFPYPEGRIYEDLATTHKVIGACERIALSSRMVYFYRSGGQGSITRAPFSEATYDLLQACSEQYDYISERFPHARESACEKCIHGGCHVLKALLSEKHPNRDAFNHVRRWLLGYADEYLASSRKDLRHAMYIRAIRAGYWPSRISAGLSGKLGKKA